MKEPKVNPLATLSEEALLATLGLDDSAIGTIERDPLATIEPNRSADSVGLRALQELASASSGRTLSSGLTLKRTLGEGGMGIVRLAVQHSLGREVAVKTTKSPLAGEAAVLRLLREAWVTGSLEHPNIVPVYDLALDQHGSPTIVLRRIEGDSWDSLMHAPDEIERRFGASDALEWNLKILIRVASAVALAHSRGIIHRDLKPENVMIGGFGEVYVLDWGVAVSLEEDPAGRLPTRSTEIAGTPAYMAPEMFGVLQQPVNERSDVYLLGGILHEILTGRPPHQTHSLHAMLLSAMQSKFTFPDVAPKRLVEIAERALSLEPDDRFSTVTELQQRIEWFLAHRGSVALSAEADARTAELMTAIGERDHQRVRRLFAECRFGFRAALRASSDNEGATAGLRRVTEAVVRFELARGAPDAAAAALAELADAPAELREGVAQALAAEEVERERLARMQREHDPTIGRRTRQFVAVVLGAFWTVSPVAGWWVERTFGQVDVASFHRRMFVWTLVVGGISCGVGWWARDSMRKTTLNRQMLAAVFVVFSSQLTLQVGASLMRLPIITTVTLLLLVWFVVASTLSAVVERRLYPAALTFLLAFVAVAAEPSVRWFAIAIANFSIALVLGRAWREQDARQA